MANCVDFILVLACWLEISTFRSVGRPFGWFDSSKDARGTGRK
jgi:hypothetical protein